MVQWHITVGGSAMQRCRDTGIGDVVVTMMGKVLQ